MPKSKVLKPITTARPRLGIIGGGQLAKMTAAAAVPLGCEVIILEKLEDFPANSLDTHALIGDWNDPVWLLKLAGLSDAVAIENEFVNSDSLRHLEQHRYRLVPGANTMALVQDKLVQKQTFDSGGIPVIPFKRVSGLPDVLSAGEELGWPLVLKKRRNGYDGKGNATVYNVSDAESAWKQLNGTSVEALYVEAFCPFERELAVIVTRSSSGECAVYPVVETINSAHICNVVLAPADISPAIASNVSALAVQAVEAIDGTGSFGVEFFLMPDGRVLLNEIAPRVHNTGHYTIEACVCSQFENHVRAVMGWPLGSPAMVAPAAAMVNLLGTGRGEGAPVGLPEALAISGVHVHVYGKSVSQPGRKMGHVTALGATVEDARANALEAAKCIRFGVPE